MVPCVYLTSVCWSLQCLISTLTHAGGGGLLFRFTCSVVLRGGRGAADKCHWPVWGALTVFRPHWVCPCSQRVCSPGLHCSGSRLLYMAQALYYVCFQFSGTPQKCRLGWACILCLPRPEQLRQPGALRVHSPQVLCAFSPPRSQPQFPGVPVGRMGLASVLGIWSLATTLPADVNHPESQEVFG